MITKRWEKHDWEVDLLFVEYNLALNNADE